MQNFIERGATIGSQQRLCYLAAAFSHARGLPDGTEIETRREVLRVLHT